MTVQLPWPWIPGSDPVSGPEFQDRVQQNFDAISIAVGQATQYAPWRVVGATGQPAFHNSWVNFDSTHVAKFYKDPSGIVRFTGTVKSGTIGVSDIFILPVGYRPGSEITFAVASNGAFGEAIIEPTGEVYPFVGSNASFNLNGVSFRAES